MIDFARSDPRELAEADLVVEELRSELRLDPDRVLLLGAAARNAMHSALGHDFPLRGTTDLDLGLALNGWETFERIDARYPRTGSSGVRYMIAGVPVDVMPFGGVEDPDGIVVPVRRREELIVFGFDDVFDRAGRVRLPSGAEVRIPRPAGYAALKMRAWIDRSPQGVTKDAQDLAAVAYWYRESSTVADRIWNPDELAVITGADWNVDLAAATLLGRDVADELTAEHAADLRRRWRVTDHEALARAFVLPPEARWSPAWVERMTLIRAMGTGSVG